VQSYRSIHTTYTVLLLSCVQRSNVHVWFVAHPRMMYDYSSGRPPTLYDISSSAHFYNKADAGIVVHRPMSSQEECVF
jgi:twinkle protein